MFRSAATKIAHNSTIPALGGNNDLRPLQDLITAEKSIIQALQTVSIAFAKASEALRTWGSGEGEDLADTLNASYTLLYHLSSAFTELAAHEENVRTHMKAVRSREEALDELKRRRRTVGGKADAADKKLSKMSPENKNLAMQTDTLNKLRDEMRSLDAEIMLEEAKLGDFKRMSTKNWMALKFGGLQELSEKGNIVGEFGKRLLSAIPTEPSQPGLPRPFYAGHSQTSGITGEAQQAIGQVRFSASPSPTKPDFGFPRSAGIDPGTQALGMSAPSQLEDAPYRLGEANGASPTRSYMGSLRPIDTSPTATGHFLDPSDAQTISSTTSAPVSGPVSARVADEFGAIEPRPGMPYGVQTMPAFRKGSTFSDSSVSGLPSRSVDHLPGGGGWGSLGSSTRVPVPPMPMDGSEPSPAVPEKTGSTFSSRFGVGNAMPSVEPGLNRKATGARFAAFPVKGVRAPPLSSHSTQPSVSSTASGPEPIGRDSNVSASSALSKTPSIEPSPRQATSFADEMAAALGLGLSLDKPQEVIAPPPSATHSSPYTPTSRVTPYTPTSYDLAPQRTSAEVPQSPILQVPPRTTSLPSSPTYLPPTGPHAPPPGPPPGWTGPPSQNGTPGATTIHAPVPRSPAALSSFTPVEQSPSSVQHAIPGPPPGAAAPQPQMLSRLYGVDQDFPMPPVTTAGKSRSPPPPPSMPTVAEASAESTPVSETPPRPSLQLVDDDASEAGLAYLSEPGATAKPDDASDSVSSRPSSRNDRRVRFRSGVIDAEDEMAARGREQERKDRQWMKEVDEDTGSRGRDLAFPRSPLARNGSPAPILAPTGPRQQPGPDPGLANIDEKSLNAAAALEVSREMDSLTFNPPPRRSPSPLAPPAPLFAARRGVSPRPSITGLDTTFTTEASPSTPPPVEKPLDLQTSPPMTPVKSPTSPRTQYGQNPPSPGLERGLPPPPSINLPRPGFSPTSSLGDGTPYSTPDEFPQPPRLGLIKPTSQSPLAQAPPPPGPSAPLTTSPGSAGRISAAAFRRRGTNNEGRAVPTSTDVSPLSISKRMLPASPRPNREDPASPIPPPSAPLDLRPVSHVGSDYEYDYISAYVGDETEGGDQRVSGYGAGKFATNLEAESGLR